MGFKGNLKHTRYGWLRLTPAYSVHLVAEILQAQGKAAHVLDPFCGTGTTSLVCAERGISCDTTDINPFLLWLTAAKTRAYPTKDVEAFRKIAVSVAEAMRSERASSPWVPPLHQIEKWWDERTLNALARGLTSIRSAQDTATEPTTDLLKIAFCRTMIERANVSFGHQSMSFKKKDSPRASLAGLEDDCNAVAETWTRAVDSLAESARSPIMTPPRPILCDARALTEKLSADCYTCVITSPPYPNRMSYIRELRPYMYWLGYLSDGRAAGELDWQAIGGTWGCATSNVAKWTPATQREIPHDGFTEILSAVAARSPLLSRYIHKYFYDMVDHCDSLYRVVAPGGSIHYVIGNSKFYDVMLPAERIFASLFEAAGFTNISIRTLRKRTSKKELFEYVVSAKKPAGHKKVLKDE